MRRLSPSQMAYWKKCNRYWFYAKVLKLPMPQRSFQTAGQDDHKELERYLLHETIPTSPRALAVLPFIPEPPWPRECVEACFKMGEFLGYCDLVDSHEGLIRVNDHKFRYDWSFLRTPIDELKRDMQSLYYTLCATEMQNVGSYVRWLVVSRVGRKEPAKYECRPIQICYEPGEAMGLFMEHYGDAIERMQAASDEDDPSEYEPNGFHSKPRECDRYGGCYFRADCNAVGDIDALGSISKLARRNT